MEVTEFSLFQRNRDELSEMWQGRVLRATRYEPIGMVILSMLAHCYPDGYVTLLYACFPDFRGIISAPFICSTAKVDKTGAVVADVLFDDEPFPYKDYRIFRNETQMRDKLRKLADELKLNDEDRQQLFIAARKWCACDRRLDPAFDPQDPDAKRLTVN